MRVSSNVIEVSLAELPVGAKVQIKIHQHNFTKILYVFEKDLPKFYYYISEGLSKQIFQLSTDEETFSNDTFHLNAYFADR